MENSVDSVIDKMSPRDAERAAAASFFADDEDTNLDTVDNDLQEDDSEEQEVIDQDIQEDDESKIDDLITKSAKDGLTDDEIKFLQSKGVEVQIEEDKKDVVEDKVEEPYPFDDILKEIYDDEFEDNNSKNEAIREYIVRQNEASKKLYETINGSPEFQAVVSEMLKTGTDFKTALANHLDLDAVIPKPGEDGYREWLANDIKRQEKIKRQSEQEAQYVRNQQSSVVATKNFLSSTNLEDAKARDFLGFVDGLINDFSAGKVTKGNLEQLYKSWSFDNELDKVKTEAKKKEEIAERRGANRKIVAITRKKSGDGVQTLPSGGTVTRRPQTSIITNDIARQANESFMDRAKRMGVVDKIK